MRSIILLAQARLWVVDVVCGPFPDRNTPD
jgi:hypothetical protein